MSDNTLYFDRNESQYGPAPACFEALRQAEFPKLLIVRTFSKYNALAGIRIGYAVLGAELRPMLED
ncbi:MAG: aminotransferase class I/II-fold pyridoxal phosphate-dependent enzyme [Bacteroidetes bacterium]|nr:aminotransferase class I/II-fold pyridoxal phosphate-dependent enzyme [Bacteroidota bacterium]